jgi:pseudouridine kinase
MDIYDKLSARLLQEKWSHIAASKLVIADTNLPADGLSELIRLCRDSALPLFIDPVSSEKTKKLPSDLRGVTAIFPNLEEAIELAGAEAAALDKPNYVGIAQAIHKRGVQHVFITAGEQGVVYSGDEGDAVLFPSIPTDVVEVTGAGDAFVAGVAYGILHDYNYPDSCRLGLAAAHLTLQTNESVSAQLNERILQQTAKERLS